MVVSGIVRVWKVMRLTRTSSRLSVPDTETEQDAVYDVSFAFAFHASHPQAPIHVN